MKILIVTSCLLAVALCSHHEHYPQHIPVIGHNGVPLEPAEVVHARQSHLAIVAAAKAHQGYNSYHDDSDNGHYEIGHGLTHGSGYENHVIHVIPSHHHGSNYHSHHASYHVPVISHNGVPLDTPEVAHAKAAHFAAHAHAAAAAGTNHYDGHYDHHYDGHYRKRRSAYGYAAQHILGHNGVPLDTPEVAAAKSAHFAAHAKASHGYEHGHGQSIDTLSHGHHYAVHSYPELAHNGQPLETPEVVALKHAHFAAHAEANSRLGGHGGGYAHASYDDGSYHGEGYGSGASVHHGGSSYENSVIHVQPIHHSHGHHGHNGYHIPIIGHNGVPLDTPEVAAARSHHLAALAEASARSHDHGHQYY